jgi:hypothetical protein
MYLKLLQFESPEPISLVNGTFARFPEPMPESFALDVVKGLEGYALVPGRYGDVDRFVLRTPRGHTLKPYHAARRVKRKIDGKMHSFNVSNLLASVILKKDVTDNQYGILVGEDGLWVESNEDRLRLRDEMRSKISDLPRVDLSVVTRPKSDDIDVTGKGYVVDGGVVYFRGGNRLAVQSNGRVMMTDRNGKPFRVHIGRVLFAAYPTFYRVDSAHTEIDHIDGDHMNNHPGNFRPVTKHQNAALAHQTGERVRRPGPTSSYEQFKRVFGPMSPTTIDRMISTGALRRYKKTSFWVHKLGTVLRKRRNGTFIYADATVGRNDYVVTGGFCHHIMVMIAFGKYVKGKVVMHLNNDKEDNRLANLRMGTSAQNAHNPKAVTVLLPGQDPQSFPSAREAARSIGISLTTLQKNKERNSKRSGDPVYSTSKKRIKFAAIRDERTNSGTGSIN